MISRLGRFRTISYKTYGFAVAAVAALCLATAGVAYVGQYRAVTPGLSWKQFATSTFSISYPPGYTPDPSYSDDISPGRHSTGVKFTITPSLAAGTNLSPDTYISVESLPTLVACSATPYIYDSQTFPLLTDDGHVYSVAKRDGAAAGNIYEEQVYARIGEERCLAVRYFIHSTGIGNYEDDTVATFDRGLLLAQFDQIRRSLVLKETGVK